jgi:ribosomal protein S12 methylthiotransferase accessory factor
MAQRLSDLGAFPNACSDGPPIFFRGVERRNSKDRFDGTYRVCPPEETLARITPLLPAAGITRLANVTGLDRIGIPVVMSVRPDGVTLSVAAGKGFTLAAAKVSAAMEALEIFHAETARLKTIVASHREISQTGSIVPIELLALCKNSLFHPDRDELWTEGWDLISNEPVFVPMAQVVMPNGNRAALANFQIGSNGLASGNVFLEAVCHALLEVIERDAVSVGKLRPRSEPVARKIDPRSLGSAMVDDLVDRCEAAGTTLVARDFTADTNVPTYVVRLIDNEIRHMGVYGGYGTHLDPATAMLRAITEAAQSRVVYIAGARDDLMALDYRRAKKFDDWRAAIDEQTPPEGPRTIDVTPSLEGDIHLLLERVTKVGIEQVIVIDMTRPPFDVPVVRVIVPGLEGYMFDHYVPGPRGRRAREGSLR